MDFNENELLSFYNEINETMNKETQKNIENKYGFKQTASKGYRIKSVKKVDVMAQLLLKNDDSEFKKVLESTQGPFREVAEIANKELSENGSKYTIDSFINEIIAIVSIEGRSRSKMSISKSQSLLAAKSFLDGELSINTLENVPFEEFISGPEPYVTLTSDLMKEGTDSSFDELKHMWVDMPKETVKKKEKESIGSKIASGNEQGKKNETIDLLIRILALKPKEMTTPEARADSFEEHVVPFLFKGTMVKNYLKHITESSSGTNSEKNESKLLDLLIGPIIEGLTNPDKNFIEGVWEVICKDSDEFNISSSYSDNVISFTELSRHMNEEVNKFIGLVKSKYNEQYAIESFNKIIDNLLLEAKIKSGIKQPTVGDQISANQNQTIVNPEKNIQTPAATPITTEQPTVPIQQPQQDMKTADEIARENFSFTKRTFQISQEMITTSNQFNMFATAMGQLSASQSMNSFMLLSKAANPSFMDQFLNKGIRILSLGLLNKGWKEKREKKLEKKAEGFAAQSNAAKANIEGVLAGKTLILTNKMLEAFEHETERTDAGKNVSMELLSGFTSFVRSDTIKQFETEQARIQMEEVEKKQAEMQAKGQSAD